MDILIIFTTFALSFINNGAKIHKMYVRTKDFSRKVMRKASNLSDFKVSTPKMQSKTAKFLQELADRIEQAIYEECLTEDWISVNVEYHDGWIEVFMKNDGTCEVAVCHSDNEHVSPTLEATIAGILPDWYSVKTRALEEERKEQEFRDYLWRYCRY